VVEDDEDLRETIVQALEMSGCQVREAANGRRALESIDEVLPDVILLDLRMPVMSGAQFIEQLRQRRSVQPPVILVSASSEVERSAAQLGAKAWLEKPFEIDALIEKVQRLIP
ncbi:MAG: response regulator, partial [Myxococcaceae bacterium]|nr:response regulator [Myxococcaceae bacterium]